MPSLHSGRSLGARWSYLTACSLFYLWRKPFSDGLNFRKFSYKALLTPLYTGRVVNVDVGITTLAALRKSLFVWNVQCSRYSQYSHDDQSRYLCLTSTSARARTVIISAHSRPTLRETRADVSLMWVMVVRSAGARTSVGHQESHTVTTFPGVNYQFGVSLWLSH